MESGNESVSHPQTKTMGQILGNSARLASISRLLEMGALRTNFFQYTPELLAKHGDSADYDFLKYECTEFGVAMIQEAATRSGLLSPEMQEYMESLAPEGGSRDSPPHVAPTPPTR